MRHLQVIHTLSLACVCLGVAKVFSSLTSALPYPNFILVFGWHFLGSWGGLCSGGGKFMQIKDMKGEKGCSTVGHLCVSFPVRQWFSNLLQSWHPSSSASCHHHAITWDGATAQELQKIALTNWQVCDLNSASWEGLLGTSHSTPVSMSNDLGLHSAQFGNHCFKVLPICKYILIASLQKNQDLLYTELRFQASRFSGHSHSQRNILLHFSSSLELEAMQPNFAT